jgi:hypothetical protein
MIGASPDGFFLIAGWRGRSGALMDLTSAGESSGGPGGGGGGGSASAAAWAPAPPEEDMTAAAEAEWRSAPSCASPLA